MVILGVPGLIAAGLAFLIPETDGVELPQNMKDTLKDMTELEPMTTTEKEEKEQKEWKVALAFEVIVPLNKIFPKKRGYGLLYKNWS